MSDKLTKSEALYFEPTSIGAPEGAHCGICRDYIGNPAAKGRCVSVAGPIDGRKGICGLYVFGAHYGPVTEGLLTHEESGYAENGPTHCGNCRYFGGGMSDEGPCMRVEGAVNFFGCCNLWERATPGGEV